MSCVIFSLRAAAGASAVGARLLRILYRRSKVDQDDLRENIRSMKWKLFMVSHQNQSICATESMLRDFGKAFIYGGGKVQPMGEGYRYH